MISYDTRNWISPLMLHRSDTFRRLIPVLIVVGVFSWAVGYLEIKYLKMSSSSLVSNLPIMHSILGFAISMLLVFRTNTAYDRWWEGRKLWGQLVNSSRNLAIKVQAHLVPTDPRAAGYFARMIPLFTNELRVYLQAERTRLELDELPHPELANGKPVEHLPMRIAAHMQQHVASAHKEGRITGEQLLVLDRELAQFMEICGACERIKNTPIPYSYSSFIKKFIVIYVFTLPFGFVFSLGYISIPVVMFIFYVMASLELIAEEIEDPFGTDANDLPMTQIADKIRGNVEEVLGAAATDGTP